MMDFSDEIKILAPLAESLTKTKDLGEKQEILLAHRRVATAIASGDINPFIRLSGDLSSKNALFALSAIGQESLLDVSLLASENENFYLREKVRKILSYLTSIDRFYESIGGIVGYQLKVLRFLDKEEEPNVLSLTPAKFFDIRTPTARVKETVLEGLKALSEMGEVYPIGGLGSRLNLKNKTGNKDLPAALLPFSGRTLLEGLIRDLQAREFCYFRLFGKQVTVPVAIMTSKGNENDLCIQEVCSKKKWFQRPREAFFLFSQISVPVVTASGNWCLKEPLQLYLQPGGHGALWRTAEEQGVFSWFLDQEKSYLLIRQINNPIAGVDHGLSALMGYGKKEKKTFGFASCERRQTAAEGALVFVEEKETVRLSNIEYTDFQKFGIVKRLENEPFLANTNILFVDLQKISSHIKKAPLPGLMLNMKNTISYLEKDGTRKEMLAGRLESMMQNISDILVSKKNEALPTFLTLNERRKTISAAKKTFKGDLLETPEGAFYDLLKNAHELLEKECECELDPFCSPEEYLNEGPNLIFLYHPALGPFYEIIAQKVRGGIFQKNAEMQLEIADVLLENLSLQGSFLIEAKNLLGHSSQEIVRYSHYTGKCILRNVRIKNKGFDAKSSVFWKNQIRRKEAFRIILEGRSEFFAENVTFEGGQTLVVPDGERWIASQDPVGKISFEKEKADWEFTYKLLEDCSIKVEAEARVWENTFQPIS